MKPIQIGDIQIGPGLAPFIIAEMSGNHGQSLDKAYELIDAAADAGAHAIKLQTYTPDTITLDCHEGEFFIEDPNSLWKGKSLYDLYKEAMTPWEWHADLFHYASEKGLIAFSTPFDVTAVDFLETLNPPCYKVASFENTDHAILAAVAKTGKPVIVSTGMATTAEIAETVDVLRSHGCVDLVLLKCTSSYPANPTDANIRTIPHMSELFECHVGLSDHTLGIGVAIAATALGATVIEKHLVMERDSGEVDAEFSLEPHELKLLVTETARAAASVGKVSYGSTESEKASMVHRRSLYIAKDMKVGDVLNEENLRSIRPGLGLAPKYLPLLLGKKVSRDIAKGTPMNWDLL